MINNYIFGILGLISIIIGTFMLSVKKNFDLGKVYSFLLFGGIFLLIYSILINDLIFIILQAVYTITIIYNISQLKNEK